MLDEQSALRDDQKSLREYLEVQFALIRRRDFKAQGTMFADWGA